MNAKHGSLLILTTALLAACGQHGSDQIATHAASNAASSAQPAQAGEGTNGDAAKAFADAQMAKEAAQPKADPSVPLANYTPIEPGDGGTWLTYVDVSRADRTPDDEALLGMFSPRYFNETDAFKKHDLVPVELPPVKANLKRYADQAYYALPFGDPAAQGINPSFSAKRVRFQHPELHAEWE